jgi:hypothetical protein
MPEQLLDRIHAEIRERLDASRAAYDESQRLTAALDALGHGEVEPASPRSTSTPRPRRARTPKPRARARAPRGQNLRLIREAVNDRPGATAGEIASATGIAPATVASTLGKLARDGELQRTTLPSGRVGFGIATEAPATPVAEPPTPSGDDTP